MKCYVAGGQNMTGLSKATKSPFSMPRLFILSPVENVNSANIQIQGFGYKMAEIEVDPVALSQFALLKYPCVLDLETGAVERRGKLETIVTGIVPSLPKA